MKIVRRLLSHGSLALAVCASTGCGEPPVAEEILRPVRTEIVAAGGVARVREFAGTARAGQEIALSFRVPGRVERIDVRVGETVERGRLLARLERTDFQIAVRQAEAALEQARANFRNAESELERTRGLYEDQNASKGDLDRVLAAYQSTRALVDAAEQTLASERRRVSYTELRAPVDGSIAEKLVEVNENVGQGSPVFRINSGGRVEVEVAIPGGLITRVREGDPAGVFFDALGGRLFPAVVTEVGVAATGAATTFPVIVRLEEEETALRPGMAASVRLEFSAGDDAPRIHLPSHAVGEDAAGRFVFVLEDTEEDGVGRVRRQAVEIGDWTTDGLEIVSGLSEGQEVVTAGVRRLTDGQRVRLLEERAAR